MINDSNDSNDIVLSGVDTETTYPSTVTTDIRKLTNLIKVNSTDAMSTTSFRKTNEDGSVIEIEEDAGEVYKRAMAKLTPEMRERLYYLHMQDEKLSKSLKKNKYSENKSKFSKTFVIQNKSTKKIVAIDALSSIHACNMAGWNPKKVILLEEKKKES